MSVAEAMAVGLPAIGGRSTPAVPWLLDEGRAGALVDVNDAKSIAREIVAMAGDQDRWRAISTACRNRARDVFAASAVASRFEGLYAGILAQGSPRPFSSEVADVVQT
jgi:glycosyltransferase involved in cell wall biosynthesis